MSADFVINANAEGIQFHLLGLSFQSYFSLSFKKECFLAYSYSFGLVVVMSRCPVPIQYGISTKALSIIFKDAKHIESVSLKVWIMCFQVKT